MTDHEGSEWETVVGRWGIPSDRWEELREHPEIVDEASPDERRAFAHDWIERNRHTVRRMAVVRSAHCPTTGRYPTIAGVYEVPRVGPCLSMAVDAWESVWTPEGSAPRTDDPWIVLGGSFDMIEAMPDRLVVLAEDDRETIPINCPTCWSALTLRRHDLDAVLAEYHRTGRASRVLIVAD